MTHAPRTTLPLVLALALALCAPCVPAQANDFYPPSPVPSSRNNLKPVAKTKKTPVSWNNLKTSNKIVKTTKPTGAVQTTTTGASTAQ